jgi:hypothetical protein
MSDVVQKLWGFCHTLRHDGIDYGDYIEQITYLLFLNWWARHSCLAKTKTRQECLARKMEVAARPFAHHYREQYRQDCYRSQ